MEYLVSYSSVFYLMIGFSHLSQEIMSVPTSVPNSLSVCTIKRNAVF